MARHTASLIQCNDIARKQNYAQLKVCFFSAEGG